MHQQDYATLFEAAIGHRPYPCQHELAASGSACASRLISVPTGMSKTAAVTLAWLWNRVVIGNDAERDGLLMCWSLIFITLLMDDFLFSHCGAQDYRTGITGGTLE